MAIAARKSIGSPGGMTSAAGPEPGRSTLMAATMPAAAMRAPMESEFQPKPDRCPFCDGRGASLGRTGIAPSMETATGSRAAAALARYSEICCCRRARLPSWQDSAFACQLCAWTLSAETPFPLEYKSPIAIIAMQLPPSAAFLNSCSVSHRRRPALPQEPQQRFRFGNAAFIVTRSPRRTHHAPDLN